MSIFGASEIVHKAVVSWEGVTSRPHRYGGTEYRLGKREIGHIHGDSLVDIPFPRKVRGEYLRATADVERAIELLRLSFNLAAQKGSQLRT